MLKTIKKTNIIFISILLVIVCGFVYCTTDFLNAKQTTESQAMVRNIEINKNEIDYQSILDEFEDSKLETKGALTTFEGYKTLNLAELDGFDLVSDTDIEDTEVSVKYNFSYDDETNIVTLSAELKDELGEIHIDTLTGTAFINEDGETDAVMNVDGESILLSEMQDAGMIQNCGWFSKLFKKIVIAVAAVVVVAAVAATIVATAGAGLGACIVAGAIAGGVTGAVAGGIISYTEYGTLDWKWVVGGAVIGGALGAMVGWGVGSLAMKTPLAKTNRFNLQRNKLIKAAEKGKLKFSNTVKSYYTSGQRPYSNSNQLVEEIMKAKSPVADPQSSTGLKWLVEGNFNGTNGYWELIVDTVTQTVWHLVFKS